MISAESTLIRNKIIGVLLRKARTGAKKTVQECAQTLGIDPAFITRAEEGQESPTLPQLEGLAHILEAPLSYFLEAEDLSEDKPSQQRLPYPEIMRLRRKIIGVTLRQARQEVGRTLEEIASSLGYTPEYLVRVELGEAYVPLVRLQVWGDMLGIPFTEFTAEDVVPLSPEEQSTRDLTVLDHLPPEVREFIAKPINIPYLQIAMNLSRMPAETLRQIASGLLEITY
jgi:transcriptional regulator with XRE-family HTH domain